MNLKGRSGIAASIMKYGFDKHKIETIHELPIDVSKECLDAYECLYMDQYSNCGVAMLNLKSGGASGVLSKASRIKMAKSKMGKDGGRRLGTKHSEYTKLKMRESQKKRLAGVPHFNIGKKRTLEERQKLSSIQKSIGISQEKRDKMLMGILNSDKIGKHKRTDEYRKMMSDKMKGVVRQATCRRVIDTETMQIYDSASSVSRKFFPLQSTSALRIKLCGIRKNNTRFVYLDSYKNPITAE